MANFQRGQSKVWWGNGNFAVPSDPYRFYYDQHDSNRAPPTTTSLAQQPDLAITTTTTTESQSRRDSPGSLRSQDSGFNDSSEHSPNTSNNSSQISSSPHRRQRIKENRNLTKISPNKLSPKVNVNQQINSQIINDISARSPSICSETKTPPTVIRRKVNPKVITPAVRRISFSAPSSPDIVDNVNKFDSFRSLDSFINNVSQTTAKESKFTRRRANGSLQRGKTISPRDGLTYRRITRRRLLDCVSQVSGSTSDVYMLAEKKETKGAAEDRQELNNSYESLISTSFSRLRTNNRPKTPPIDYNNETVTFDNENENETSVNDKSVRARLPLPTYDQLYPPNGSSTPKMLRLHQSNLSQRSDHTQSSTIGVRGNSFTNQNQSRQELDSELDISLSATLNWETCTFIEYTNPALNGHASSVQFWLDEMRSTQCHEIMSTLQTKSILYEAARQQKLNPTIASKLIYQIQLKAIDIETNFNDVERVFESHAKLLKKLQRRLSYLSTEGEDIYATNNGFKEAVSVIMKQLTTNVCQFMSKLNSKIIFQEDRKSNGDLKKFEQNVKNVIDLAQDLRVACETKIDDIEPSVLLKDLHSLKRSVLKTIRKVFQKLVNIIVSRIESTNNHLLIRANINMIATLPTEGVYNSTERFSSLTDAFITTGTIRVLLMTCLELNSTSIRALALRALTTICASTEMIEQFLETGGLDVVTDLLTNERRIGRKYEPELREAVSVLTQITAPWHTEGHVDSDDLLKISIDKLVAKITTLSEDTECPQTLMLCTACLNNLSRKSTLTFYSLMSNRSVHRLIQACDKQQQGEFREEYLSSAIFLYVISSFFFIFLYLKLTYILIFSQEQLTSILFNMAGNKKCHQHLAAKDIIYFMSFIFQTQFHVKYATQPEQAALKKTIKNILHTFARLIHHSVVGHEILENNVIPIFSRVEQNLVENQSYSKDLMYINAKLSNSNIQSPLSRNYQIMRNNSMDESLGHQQRSSGRAKHRSPGETSFPNERRLSLNNSIGTTVLESYV